MDMRKNTIELNRAKLDQQLELENGTDEALLESPHDMLLEEQFDGIHLYWEAHEFEKHERSRRWYLIASLLLGGIIIWAIVINAPIMAITFVLAGIVGFLQLQREPQVLEFLVTEDGVVAGNEIYPFEQIKSFWIFYHPPHEKILSLELKDRFSLHVQIPLGEANPVAVRDTLMQFVPEIEQERKMIDVVGHLLKL
ncbi:hypothetical protein EPO05_02785 [Patescibacteria group bacterium]|nr:MAG: hypothetical protein EPO05_02785 [Patescibacteria group bacterium]